MIRFISREPPSSRANLDVTRLDRTGWRVSVRAGGLLGYVERLKRDRFEVLWVAEPIGWAYVESFDDALATIGDRAGFAGEIRVRREALAKASPAGWPRSRRTSFEKGA